jgi:hypothetical protein
MRLLALVQSRSGPFRVYFDLSTIITSPNFYSTPKTPEFSILWNSSARRSQETCVFHGIAQATELLAPLIYRWCSTRTASIHDSLLYTCFTCILVKYILLRPQIFCFGCGFAQYPKAARSRMRPMRLLRILSNVWRNEKSENKWREVLPQVACR